MGLVVQGAAELGLELDETVRVGEGRQLAGQLEEGRQGCVALLLERRQRVALRGRVREQAVGCARQQLGIPERVGDPVRGDRVAVVAGIADQGPAGSGGPSEVVGQGDRPAEGCPHGTGVDTGCQVRRGGAQELQPHLAAPAARVEQAPGFRGRQHEEHRGRSAVGREHAGEPALVEMELEALPGDVTDVGVQTHRARRMALDEPGADVSRDPGAQAVRADHEPGLHVQERPVRRYGAYAGGPAVPVEDHVAQGGAVEEACSRHDGCLGEDPVELVPARGEHVIDTGLVLHHVSRGAGTAVVPVEVDGADGRCAAGDDRVEETPAGQLDDASSHQGVRGRGVARQRGALEQEDVVAGARQQHRRRGAGTAGAHDHDVGSGGAGHRDSFAQAVPRR